MVYSPWKGGDHMIFIGTIHVCLVGKWVSLSDSDTINSVPALEWISSNIPPELEWLEINHGGATYLIHSSAVQLARPLL